MSAFKQKAAGLIHAFIRRVRPVVDRLVDSVLFPDFLYRRIRSYRLGGKINAIILTAALPIFILLNIIFIFLFFELSSRIDREISQKILAVKNAWTYYEQQTRIFADLVAENPFIKKELLAETVNAGPVLRITRQMAESVRVNRITVYSKSGVVVTRSHDQANFGQNLSDRDDVSRALQGKKGSYVIEAGGQMVLQSTVPVYFDSEIIGAVSAGYTLDYSFTRRINDLTQAELFILEGELLKASSLGRVEPRGEPAYKLTWREKNTDSSIRRKVRLWEKNAASSFETITYDFRYLKLDTSVLKQQKLDPGILVIMDQSGARLYLIILLSVSLLLSVLVIFSGIILAVRVGRNISGYAAMILETMDRFRSGEMKSRVEVSARDELGQVAEGFNDLADRLQEKIDEIKRHNDELEEKVSERTRDLQLALDDVTRLKETQDGDYLLSSLLLRPLIKSDHSSTKIMATYVLEQKKKFNYHGRTGDIGGDLCFITNLTFKDFPAPFTFFFNGDAMGKSSQGASGALICGVTLQNVINRSRRAADGIPVSPERWLARLYYELHQIFLLFDGSMLMSAACGLIDETTGRCYYFNSEHPWTVLYRDRISSYIEHELTMHKFGVSLGMQSAVIRRFKLHPGDILVLGSDGREDIEQVIDGEPQINAESDFFTRCVDDAGADLDRLVDVIKASGRVTDDLSLIRIEIRHDAEFDDSDHNGIEQLRSERHSQ